MSAVDVVTSLAVVACAAGFLARRVTAPTSVPTCHVVGGPCTRSGGSEHEGGGEAVVVVGASLARGMARASRRRGESPQK